MDKIYKRVVLSELRKFKKADEEYRQDREDWYRTGDGRRPKWYQGPDDDRPTTTAVRDTVIPTARMVRLSGRITTTFAAAVRTVIPFTNAPFGPHKKRWTNTTGALIGCWPLLLHCIAQRRTGNCLIGR